ncbi:uncharacterized protein LOC134812777 isoform X2 [Bolinopsis microptera]|uniref:uncharacterized protein LOC134812777 isoform X2 n=1 Tax=Bolinopsis microptera TaxID=2820187 RepID=UPI003079D70F
MFTVGYSASNPCGYQPSRTNIKFFSSMPKKVKPKGSVSETETAENRQEHSHNKLPPLTKLTEAKSPWHRESSPWLQDSPQWQQSFSPWQNDQAKSHSRTGFYQTPVQDHLKSSKSSRNKAVVSLAGNLTSSAPNSLYTCSNNQSGDNHMRKVSISTPVLDCLAERKPSRGQLQGCRTAPGRNRDPNRTYLFCPQRQISEDLQTDFYLTSLDTDEEETLDAVGGIEDYKHLAIRNPNGRTELDLQQVYDRTYRPSLKLPKCDSALLTTIKPQFINNNCANQQSPAHKKVTAAEHSNLSCQSSDSSTDLKSASEGQEGKRVRFISPAKCSPTKKQSTDRNMSWLSYKLPSGSSWGFRKYRTFD